jgi:hypothetical protein
MFKNNKKMNFIKKNYLISLKKLFLNIFYFCSKKYEMENIKRKRN